MTNANSTVGIQCGHTTKGCLVTHLIDAATCEELLDPAAVIAELSRAHVAHHRAQIVQPVPTALAIPPRVGANQSEASLQPRHVLMSAADHELTMVKVLLDAPGRRSSGGPTQRSVISVYSTATGDCLAVIDGRALTRVRTAAATILATATLARADARTLGIIGAGALAQEHLRAAALHLDLEEVVVWSRTPESAEYLREKAHELGLSARAVNSPGQVAAQADMVMCVTPATVAHLDAADLRPGLHVSAVGSPPRPGYRELTPQAFLAANLVVVDDVAIARAESAQVQAALEAGLTPSGLVEIGAILASDHPGRTSEDQITVHSSIGVGLQDLAAVHLLLDRLGIAMPAS